MLLEVFLEVFLSFINLLVAYRLDILHVLILCGVVWCLWIWRTSTPGQLRPYGVTLQSEFTLPRSGLINSVFDAIKGKGRVGSYVRVCSPSGTGKTALAQLVIEKATKHGWSSHHFTFVPGETSDGGEAAINRLRRDIEHLPPSSLVVLDDAQHSYTRGNEIGHISNFLRDPKMTHSVLLLMVHPFNHISSSPIVFQKTLLFDDIRFSDEEATSFYRSLAKHYRSFHAPALVESPEKVFAECEDLVLDQTRGHVGAIYSFASIINDNFRSGVETNKALLLSRGVLGEMGRLWSWSVGRSTASLLGSHRDLVVRALSGTPMPDLSDEDSAVLHALLRFGVIYQTKCDQEGDQYGATSPLAVRLFLHELYPTRDTNLAIPPSSAQG